MIDAIVREREAGGKFHDINNFLSRMSAGNEVNKRAVENFIKAGAFDSLGGTRLQFMSVYSRIMDRIHDSSRNNMAGQMSLFDLASEEDKSQFEIQLPNVGEYDKDMLLEFEKEVLGIYVSGHPLEEYAGIWKKNITNQTIDFYIDEETGEPLVKDNAQVTIGGIIVDKKVKYTRNDKVMAFLTIEDLYGSVEVIVFPKTYEANAGRLNEDSKVFIKGHVSVEEDKDAKVIANRILMFDEVPKTVWIQIPDMATFEAKEQTILELISGSKGSDSVVVYIKETKQMKKYPTKYLVRANETFLNKLEEEFGKDNIRTT